MNGNRFTRSQILAILKEVKRTGDRAKVCRRHNITVRALNRWQRALGTTDAATDAVATPRWRTLEVEEEDAWLKWLLANRYVSQRRRMPGKS